MTKWFGWIDFFRHGTTLMDAPWPPPLPEDPEEEVAPGTISPLAAPVHVQSRSAVVRVDNGVLIVERDAEPPFERPIELVSAVHIHGPATVTSPCVSQLVAQGTPVVWRSVSGYPIAYASPLHQSGLEARRGQYATAESLQGLAVAQAIVAAKIVNMRGLVRNIYLHPVDRLMAMNGYRMVRYADDFVVLTPDAKTASRALKDVERFLRNRGLSLNPDKTRIASPGDVVQFLGCTVRATCPEPPPRQFEPAGSRAGNTFTTAAA